MDKIHFSCDVCKKRYNVERRHAGVIFPCKNCGSPVFIPQNSTRLPSTPSEHSDDSFVPQVELDRGNAVLKREDTTHRRRAIDTTPSWEAQPASGGLPSSITIRPSGQQEPVGLATPPAAEKRPLSTLPQHDVQATAGSPYQKTRSLTDQISGGHGTTISGQISYTHNPGEVSSLVSEVKSLKRMVVFLGVLASILGVAVLVLFAAYIVR